MAITYTNDLEETNIWTIFTILRRWRGSVFKLVWSDFLLFSIQYWIIAIIHHGIIRKYKIELLEDFFNFFTPYCDKMLETLPVAFVLGFYVSTVVTWWQEQYNSLPWPDDVAIQVCAFVVGDSENALLMRRTIIRYINLSMIIALQGVSGSARRKFPNYKSIQAAGLMNEVEMNKLLNVDNTYNQYYLPILWAANLIKKSRQFGYIVADRQLDILIEHLATFRQKLGDIFANQWLNPPLMYSQVASITVYTYFVVALFAWQFTDAYDFPYFGVLQFVFYMGWLRVAQNLLYPFDDKDDGFDIGFLIERNIQMGYLIVDDLYRKHPDIAPDSYWDPSIILDNDLKKFTIK